MTDIQNKEDIALIIDKFYKKVIVDPVIGHFFTDVMTLSWDVHIPIMVSFWNSILFGVSDYNGNPMTKHVELNKLSAMEPKHFEHWLALWTETIHENFTGEKSEEAIKKATDIAQMIQYKINAKGLI